ncbi:hypothetical protein JCM8547_000630 [Rhodosporidiobolus lusitaniae]
MSNQSGLPPGGVSHYSNPSNPSYAAAERAAQAANAARGGALPPLPGGEQVGQGGQGGMGHKQAGFSGSQRAQNIRNLDPRPRGAPNSLTPAQPAPPTTSASPATVFPALHLTPLNGTFVPKQISLDPPGTRVKIGRQTNAKTIPNGTNGYFDSKVLSRAHAEVWSEDGKVFIKDVKSSNGTFINGERLSPESSESDVFQLNTDDVVEFGIDILTDDTKTIVHHKVAAKVHLVLDADDAAASSREINNWYRSAGEQPMSRARPARPAGGGQNGLSFEHVLSRLQGELQKSRDTGANLADVNSSLTAVHDTLGGGAPPPLPPNAGIPGRSGPSAFPPRDNPSHAQSIAALQSQLAETQSSLQGHVGKIRDLEGLLAEHDTIKREVGTLRQQMEEAQVSWQAMMRERERENEADVPRSVAEARENGGRESPIAALLEAQEAADQEAEEEDVDFDDAASVSSVDTIAPSRPNGITKAEKKEKEMLVDGKEEEEEATDAPSSPPPASTPARDPLAAAADAEADLARERLLQEQNAKLVARLEALSAELEEATKLGSQLREQHASASLTIKALEERIAGLEKAVEGRVAEVEGRAEERWVSWRERFEQSWKTEREGWEAEREGLKKLVRDWEEGKEREKKEREEARRRREERRKARAAKREADGEEEEDESIGDEEDVDESDEDDEEDSGKTSSSGNSPSKRSSPSKPRRLSRRDRSSSPTPTPSSAAAAALSSAAASIKSGLPASISPSSAEALTGAAGSDSDSTIGERNTLRGGVNGAEAARLRSQGGRSPNSVGGQKNGESQGLPFSLAGAVVVIAVAVGYGAAMKLKE